MNALSAAPDWRHVAVAGREVLKIVRVHERDDASGYPARLEVVQNFRTGKMNLNYSSNDVVWHPLAQFHRWMATGAHVRRVVPCAAAHAAAAARVPAATNGAVVIWNTLQPKTIQKQVSVIKDHKRTGALCDDGAVRRRLSARARAQSTALRGTRTTATRCSRARRTAR